MKAWYSKVRDTELKDGSVRATYVVTFETDNADLKREVEKYLQGIMDKTEPTISKMEQVDEPKTQMKTQNSNLTFEKADEPTWEQVKEYCNKRCLDIVDSALRGKWYKEEPHIVGKHADVVIIDETRLTAKCLNCANGGSYKCSKCDGEMYYKYDKDEPQTSCKTCRFGEVDEGYVRCAYYSKATEQDEPQTDCAWK